MASPTECDHPAMIKSDRVTEDNRVYSYCPDCGSHFHPDSIEVSGPPEV